MTLSFIRKLRPVSY